MSILQAVSDGKSLKELNINELEELCGEIRKTIIDATYENGGHLSSNLGCVELTVALYYVFNFPSDKLIFDVGHQSYTHKILSGRYDRILTIREENGLSGFPNPDESNYDAFSAGHAGTSIAAGLGFCDARDKLKDDYYVIDVVGDSSIFNGENLEALSQKEIKPNKFLIVLNDNGMSISKNNNGLYKLISKITTKKHYNRVNDFLNRTIGKCFIGKFLKKLKKSFKLALNRLTVLDLIGIKYVGVFDGHNLKQLIEVLQNIKESENPTILHIDTIKGKGYAEAENDSTKYHGVSKKLNLSTNYFSDSVSGILTDIIKDNSNIMAITAAMPDGVGLSEFAKAYPNNFKDVGICEEFAVTYAAALAKGGIRPIVFIYSTFLQRSYDQIIHDVCLQNLPVIFCIDRAGLVGSDGKTHQGVFDLSYLSHIPNLTIFAPKDKFELKKCIEYSLSLNSPVAIRYPNGAVNELDANSNENVNKWEEIVSGEKTVILAVGNRMIELALKVRSESKQNIAVYNARCVKPLDEETLKKLDGFNIITLEENSEIGGFGSLVQNYCSKNLSSCKVKTVGVKDKFVEHATVESQQKHNGLTVEDILKLI